MVSFHPVERSFTGFVMTPTVSSEYGFSLKTRVFTPWKINMKPTNVPFRKEHDLPNHHDYVPC